MKTTMSLFLLSFLFAHASAQLKLQEKAPNFTANRANGKTLQLSDYQGKKVLLTFMRFTACPVCNYRIHELTEQYPALQKQNIEVIAVFESGTATLAPYSNDAQIPFPLISDTELKLYGLYHTQSSVFKMMRTLFKKAPKTQMKEGEKLYQGKKYDSDGKMTRIPADFIIDEKGMIQQAHYGKYIGDHIPLDTLLP